MRTVGTNNWDFERNRKFQSMLTKKKKKKKRRKQGKLYKLTWNLKILASMDILINPR